MPELPEVETTVRGLQKEVIGLKITDIWTDLATNDKRKHDTVANPKYFKLFKKEVLGKKIVNAQRRAKNILINLSGGKTILIHLKMTGYLFYGKEPKIKFAHVIFTLSNKHYLVFSDMRKFGKITLLDTDKTKDSRHLAGLGPEPLDKDFDLKKLKERLNKKPNGKIKTVLMDQQILVGIGNIYSDEILWRIGIHPERKIKDIQDSEFKKMLPTIKNTLKKGIDFGGDSMSDYKNIYGLKGAFQLHHEAYMRTKEKCRMPQTPPLGHQKNRSRSGTSCTGVIIKKMINNRSAHFCNIHQI